MKEEIYGFWNASTMYQEGDKVIFNGVIYQLKKVKDRFNISIETLCFVPIGVVND